MIVQTIIWRIYFSKTWSFVVCRQVFLLFGDPGRSCNSVQIVTTVLPPLLTQKGIVIKCDAACSHDDSHEKY